MTHQCIVIDVHLAVYRYHFIIGRFEQRVDLKHGAIQSNISVVQVGHKLHHILERITTDTEIERDLTCLEGLQSAGRMHPLTEDLFRCIMRHVFDVHTAFRRVHDHVLSCPTVQKDREIELFPFRHPIVIHILGNEDLTHHFTRRSGLQGHQGTAEDLLGDLNGVIGTLRHLHPIDAGFLDGAFTATTRMDLGLHHSEIAAILIFDIPIRFFRFVNG